MPFAEANVLITKPQSSAEKEGLEDAGNGLFISQEVAGCFALCSLAKIETEQGSDHYLQIHQRNKCWGGRGAAQEQYWHKSLRV